MPKTLRTLVENAHKNSVSLRRHRTRWEDAGRVRQAEKTGRQQASLELLLGVLLKKTAMAHFVRLST